MKSHPPNDDGLQDLWLSLRTRALRRGADHHTAEDVAQDTWVRALEKPPEERGRFRAWMLTVSERVLSDTWRRQGHRMHREAASARPADFEPDDEAVDASRLVQLVKELPAPYGEVVWMRFFEDRSIPRIAGDLGRSEEAVRTQLRRGLERLRARLGPHPPERFYGLAGLAWLWRKLRDLIRRPRIAGALGATVLVVGGLGVWREPGTSADGDSPAVALEAPRTLAGASAVTSGTELRTPVPVGPSNRSLLAASPLSGLVLDRHGRPVPGARVHAGLDDEHLLASTKTDATGRFEIVAPGRTLLWAEHDDWMPSMRCYLATVRGTGADLVLGPEAVAVALNVVDAGGRPVGGAELIVETDPDREHTATSGNVLQYPAPEQHLRTDAAGRVEVRLPAGGRVRITVIPVAGPPWQGFRVSRGEPVGIRLNAGIDVEGLCVDEAGAPIASSTVEVVQFRGLAHRLVNTDPAGRFRIPGVAAGPFALIASEPSPGRRSALFQGFLEPGAGELRLVLNDTATIAGTLMDEHGPVAGARVDASLGQQFPELGTGERRTITDALGRFRFPGCRENAHELLFTRAGEDQPSLRRTKVRPDALEQVFEMPPVDLVRAPLEIAFVGPGRAPLLLEVRATGPPISVVLEPDENGLFVSEPLPGGEYFLQGWDPELGSWGTGTVMHDADAPLRIEQLSLLDTHLELALHAPSGIEAHQLTVSIETKGFDYYGLGSSGHLTGWRELPVRAAGRATGVARALIAPRADTRLRVTGPGMADVVQQLSPREGSRVSLDLRLQAGVDVRLVIVSDAGVGLMPHETLVVECETPAGDSRLLLRDVLQVRVANGSAFDVRLPVDATRVRLFTIPKIGDNGFRWTVRRGTLQLEPGALEGTGGVRPEIVVHMVPDPR